MAARLLGALLMMLSLLPEETEAAPRAPLPAPKKTPAPSTKPASRPTPKPATRPAPKPRPTLPARSPIRPHTPPPKLTSEDAAIARDLELLRRLDLLRDLDLFLRVRR